MNLSRYTLKNITSQVAVPGKELFDLPEKVLQFGTGVLLRGLPDYFIDKANRQGLFNGRIVVVKSTSHGDTSAFDKQDCLYTVCVRGIENGEKIEENIINSSISRVLNATDEWDLVLECAHNQNLQVIISNTTEVGIQLSNDNIRQHPPKSFPGKLLAFLLERFNAFGGSPSSGMVIVPTELIPENGKKLESIVLELAHLNGMEDSFIEWIEQHNCFCNSLVDRIVPGKPDKEVMENLVNELGYEDQLLTMAEVYRLWAIEGDDHVKDILSFSKCDEGVVIADNIDVYRELKLRLLNGTHTLSCGLAFLANCDTVRQAMENDLLSSYMSELMLHEIAVSIPYHLDLAIAIEFGQKVLDRFRNPYIRHSWLNITLNYSEKMKMRCIPVLSQHYKNSEAVPELFALGFAAYLYFMKAVKVTDGQYYGEHDGREYLIQDDQAEKFFKRWMGLSVAAIVKDVFGDTGFWGVDLNSYNGFKESVTDKVNMIINYGMIDAIEQTLNKKAIIV